MPLIQLPFQKGQDSKIEAKVAPSGLLKTLGNARMTKLSRVAKRGGAVAGSLTGQSGSAVVSGSLPVQALLSRSAEKLAVAKYTPEEDRVYGYAADGRLSLRGGITPWEAPELLPGPAGLRGACQEVSAASVNGHHCLVYAASNQVFAVVYGTDGVARAFTQLDTGTVLRRPRVVACGNTFVACWAENTSNERILCRSFDTATAGATWGSLQNMTNGLTLMAAQYDFDVCAYSSTQIAVTYRKSSTELSLILWTFGAGTLADSVDFTADGVGLAVLGATGENLTVAWRDDSDGFCKAQSFDGTLTSVVGPTTVFGGAVLGPVALVRLSASSVGVLWNDILVPSYTVGFKTLHTTTHALGSVATVAYGVHLASKPLLLTGTSIVFFGVNDSAFQRAYYLCALDSSGTFSGIGAMVAADHAVADTDADHLSELSLQTVSGYSMLTWGLARIVDGSTEAGTDVYPGPAVATLRLRGPGRLQTARDGASLLVAAGYLSRIDGLLVTADAAQIAPRIDSLTAGTTGSLTPSTTYQYVATLRFFDASGRLLLSQVSDPVSVTLSAAQDSVDVDYDTQFAAYFYTSSVNGRAVSGALTTDVSPRADIWRTLGDGAIFYRVSGNDGLQSEAHDFADTMSDDDARDEPVLYTQGERGGLSGPLQNDTPPPCRFIWAGKDRVMVSGLEDPSEFQFSKLFFPGEAVHFSNHRSFRGRIPGRTGPCFCLDDVWAVFSTDGLYTISGAGPDDTAQGGFDEPRKHSSHVGCDEWRSLCECPQGLTFQGNDDEIYLLPRGFGPPIWIGRAVSDHLATYPVVTSATLVPEEHIVAFTVTTSDGSSGRVLCYDYTQLDEQGVGLWSVDTIAGGAAHISGALWDGKLALATTTAIDVMTPGTYSDRTSTWYGVTIETHPIKPSGMFGDGRTRMIGVMAEYRGDCGCDIRVAVNDSQTFSSAHSFVDATAALGQTAGDQVLRGWQIPFQKGGSYSVRLSETQDASTLTEGLAFVGIAFDYRPREGLRRIAPTYR